eukprot:g38025.t1
MGWTWDKAGCGEILKLAKSILRPLGLEEAKDGHFTRRVGGGIKMDGNQKVRLVGVCRAQMPCELVPTSASGLPNIEETTSGELDTIDQGKVPGVVENLVGSVELMTESQNEWSMRKVDRVGKEYLFGGGVWLQEAEMLVDDALDLKSLTFLDALPVTTDNIRPWTQKDPTLVKRKQLVVMGETEGDKLRASLAIHGLPEVLITDNGMSFTSEECEYFLKSNGLQHMRTAPYHPSVEQTSESEIDAASIPLLPEEGKETLPTRSRPKRRTMDQYMPPVSESKSEELDLGRKRCRKSYLGGRDTVIGIRLILLTN